MLPSKHIIFGAIFSILVWLFFPVMGWLGAMIIFLSSVLIDVDHYLYYVYKKREFDIKDSVRWYLSNTDLVKKMNKKQKANFYSGLYFLHGIEAIILLILLMLTFPNIFNFTIFIIIGFLFHQVLDAINLYKNEYRLDKVMSFTYAVYNSKNKMLIQNLR